MMSAWIDVALGRARLEALDGLLALVVGALGELEQLRLQALVGVALVEALDGVARSRRSCPSRRRTSTLPFASRASSSVGAAFGAPRPFPSPPLAGAAAVVAAAARPAPSAAPRQQRRQRPCPEPPHRPSSLALPEASPRTPLPGVVGFTPKADVHGRRIAGVSCSTASSHGHPRRHN